MLENLKINSLIVFTDVKIVHFINHKFHGNKKIENN